MENREEVIVVVSLKGAPVARVAAWEFELNGDDDLDLGSASRVLVGRERAEFPRELPFGEEE